MADIRRLPTPVAEVWDWQLHGACRGENTSLFFHPDGERGPARARRQSAAKAVCARVPGRSTPASSTHCRSASPTGSGAA